MTRTSKLALMMELAWQMWTASKQSVRYRDLRPFIERLIGESKIELKDKEADEVAGEIHNASFLKRDENDEFSFMHRSFMEFFLACRLGDCIRSAEALPEMLDTRRYDQKMIYFLSQLDEKDALREPLREILAGDYQPNVSENALQILYWTARIRAGMEEEVKSAEELKMALAGRVPTGANLGGARLQEIVLECANLAEADVTGADLTKAKLNHARLDRAVLRDATLVEASMEDVTARDCDFRNVDLNRASFNRSDLTGCDFTGSLNQTSEGFVNATLTRVKGLSFTAGIALDRLRPVAQLGPGNGVNAVAVRPNGELVAVAGSDGVIRLYRPSDGALLRTLEGHTNWVTSVAFSPDGLTLASGSSDKTVRLWKPDSGKLLRSLEGHTNWVMSVAFSPDGLTLASGSSDQTVRLWKPDSGKLLRSLEGHSNWVMSVAFSPDGLTLASGSYDQTVRLWKPDSGKLLHILEGHLGPVLAVAFAPNGKYLVAAGIAGGLQFWDIATAETFLDRYSFGPGAWLDLLPDGRFDASPEGMRYLGYTEEGTFNHYTAESLVKEFYARDAVREVLARYTE